MMKALRLPANPIELSLYNSAVFKEQNIARISYPYSRF